MGEDDSTADDNKSKKKKQRASGDDDKKAKKKKKHKKVEEPEAEAEEIKPKDKKSKKKKKKQKVAEAETPAKKKELKSILKPTVILNSPVKSEGETVEVNGGGKPVDKFRKFKTWMKSLTSDSNDLKTLCTSYPGGPHEFFKMLEECRYKRQFTLTYKS